MLATVEERYGSFSRRHIRLSDSLIRVSNWGGRAMAPHASGGGAVAGHGGSAAQWGIEVCLNSLRSGQPSRSTDPLDRAAGHLGVAARVGA